MWKSASLAVALLGAVTVGMVRAGVGDFDLKAGPAEGAELARMKGDVGFALAGLRASRDLIRKGRFEAVEGRVEEVFGTGRTAAVEMTSRNAFDDDARLLRVEHEQTKPLPAPNRFTYIETPDEAFFYNHQGSFSIVRPGYLRTENANPPIDVRAVGAGFYYDHVGRGQVGKGDGLDRLIQAINERARLVKVIRRENLFIVDYFSDDSLTSRFQLTLDESKGYVPLRFEIIVKDPASQQWREDQRTETKWAEVGGVWVPESSRSTLASPRRELDLAFRWRSLNEPLDPSLFRRASIEVPDGTYVSDLTLKPGRATLVEVAGANKGLEMLERRADGYRAPLLLLNVACVIVLGCAYAFRRWRSVRLRH